MIITTMALSLILFCAFFIVVCSILHKIQIFPSTKGILCISMISIIGVLTGGMHPYLGTSLDITIVALALLIVRQTVVAYKRGFM